MPELPDVVAYIEALEKRILGQELRKIRLLTPFVLRTVSPSPNDLEGLVITEIRRLGKRIVLVLSNPLTPDTQHPAPCFIVIHLMIAGRLRWGNQGSKPPAKISHAAFEFETGNLFLTEASSKKRASIHLVEGEEGLRLHRREGLDVLTCTGAEFEAALVAENRTLKRALTNPSRFDGIGNAYSDEILHAARLSPLRLTQSLADEEVRRLYLASQETLTLWIDRLRVKFKDKFPGPGEITAFRPEFAVHGKYKKPCPVCGQPVQRISYAENETNYCADCQNEGRLLADRSLSRLLKGDWPKTLAEMEGD
ncbi:MAG: DNA-formamidopyrimidine glycosylase family protein [Fimbriimonadaceae bacterium]